MSITRLTGGLTPADGGDPRTFPAIWNATADDVEALDATVLSQGSALVAVEGTVASQGSAISVIEAWGIDDLQDVALGTALVDGQVLAYSTAIPGWTNATAAGGGKILQVVSVFKDNIFSTSSGTYVDVTGLSATITPTSSSSKIFIAGVCSVSGGSGSDTDLRLLRESTSIFRAVGEDEIFNYRTNQTLTTLSFPLSFLDSPNTTSATTYKIQMRVSGGTGYVNRRNFDAKPSVSAITVMEVAG